MKKISNEELAILAYKNCLDRLYLNKLALEKTNSKVLEEIIKKDENLLEELSQYITSC